MSVEFLNSNQVYAEVNEAYKQALGEKAVQTQSIADLISPDIKSQIGDYREQLCAACTSGAVMVIACRIALNCISSVLKPASLARLYMLSINTDLTPCSISACVNCSL